MMIYLHNWIGVLVIVQNDNCVSLLMKVGREPHYEIIEHAHASSIVCNEYKLPRFTSPYHQHLELECTSILSSHGLLLVGGEVKSFSPGDCFLLGSQLPHKFQNAVVDNDAPDWAHSLVIQFRSDCLSDDFLEVPDANKLRKLFEQAYRGVKMNGELALNCLEAMGAVFQTKGIQRIAAFLELMDLIAESDEVEWLIPESMRDFSTRSTERFDRVTGYIHEHISRKITLDELADECGMNRSSFSRYFRSITGRTLTSYLNEIRCSEVCGQLEQTDKSITEIAFDCGYENLSTFNRCFKTLKGVTPKEYRAVFEQDSLA